MARCKRARQAARARRIERAKKAGKAESVSDDWGYELKPEVVYGSQVIKEPFFWHDAAFKPFPLPPEVVEMVAQHLGPQDKVALKYSHPSYFHSDIICSEDFVISNGMEPKHWAYTYYVTLAKYGVKGVLLQGYETCDECFGVLPLPTFSFDDFLRRQALCPTTRETTIILCLHCNIKCRLIDLGSTVDMKHAPTANGYTKATVCNNCKNFNRVDFACNDCLICADCVQDAATVQGPAPLLDVQQGVADAWSCGHAEKLALVVEAIPDPDALINGIW